MRAQQLVAIIIALFATKINVNFIISCVILSLDCHEDITGCGGGCGGGVAVVHCVQEK